MNFQNLLGSRGARATDTQVTHIAATERIRPLRDNIVLQPEDAVHSRYLIVRSDSEPLKGKVLAIGPGVYPKRYDHPDKHVRKKMWDSKAFRPCDVKVGDRVEIGRDRTAFEGFYWGDTFCVWCREEDVAGIL